MNKTLIMGMVVLGAGILFAGCGASTSSTESVAPAADQKQGETSKTGTISERGGSYFIEIPGNTPELIESYQVDLSTYVGQTVTVTGQYSGDTLFVGRVE